MLRHWIWLKCYWLCFTWTKQGWNLSGPSGLHSVVAEPGFSPPEIHSFGPAQNRKSPHSNLSLTGQTALWENIYIHCKLCSAGESLMAKLSLPLSPGQKSSCPAGESAGSSFQQLPLSSSDPFQCVGKEPKHPNDRTIKHILLIEKHRYIFMFKSKNCCGLNVIVAYHNLFICTSPQSLLKASGFVPQTLILKCQCIYLILQLDTVTFSTVFLHWTFIEHICVHIY